MYRRRKRRSIDSIIAISTILLMILLLSVTVYIKGIAYVSEAASTAFSTTVRMLDNVNPMLTDTEEMYVPDREFEWNLILVNKDNPVPDHYTIEFTLLKNGEKVDSRIYPDLQKMFDEARAMGLQLFVREGYRTGEEQRQIYESKIQAYRQEGYSKTDAKTLAEEWVALPGTSEHEIGLAVDINADTSVSSREDVYSWLENNAHRFGFILRYPQGKSQWTGVEYEPWHYRYVGNEAALQIYQQSLCLEEYLQLIGYSK